MQLSSNFSPRNNCCETYETKFSIKEYLGVLVFEVLVFVVLAFEVLVFVVSAFEVLA